MNTLSYKTLSVNKETAQKEWVVVDATDQVVGRLASKVAKLLDEDERFIAKIVFIRMVLSTAWGIEENDTRIVQINIDICKRLLRLYNINS